MLPDRPAFDETTTQRAYAAPLHSHQPTLRPFSFWIAVSLTVLGHAATIVGILMPNVLIGISILFLGIVLVTRTSKRLQFPNPSNSELWKQRATYVIVAILGLVPLLLDPSKLKDPNVRWFMLPGALFSAATGYFQIVSVFRATRFASVDYDLGPPPGT